MEIQGAGSISGPDPIQPNRSSSRFDPPAARPSDKVEISELGRLKSLLDKVPDIRVDKVESIRKQIEAGTYETDEKVNEVVERLLEELG